uniref:aldehyde dehydrogenase family protein n=1 Tax=Thioclava electrotropha TaxID=1549850 RepID=UPI0023A80A2C
MSIQNILETMEYGVAPEDDSQARKWLAKHEGGFGHFIDGAMTKPGDLFEVRDPASDTVLARVTQGSASDVDAAVAAARKAQSGWAKLSGHQRATHLYALARHIQQHSRLLAVLETLDSGKPIRESRDIDIPLVARHFYHHAGWAEILEDELPGHSAQGVCGQIIPWNFPLLMLSWKVAPALVAGNTIVLKPSPFTPLTTLRIAELIKDVVPAGTVNIITGEDTLGPLITGHPDIDKITFTGSTATGKKIMEGAAGDLKRITLELGGNDASIVLPDADVEKVAEQLFWSSFSNAGQVCIAAKRIYIHEDIYDDLSKAIAEYAKTVVVGDGSQQGTGVGPIQNKKQYERVLELIQD